MQHVGEVISRERLLSEVWGYDFDPKSNVVDVCIAAYADAWGPTHGSRPFAMPAIALRPELLRLTRRYRVKIPVAAVRGCQLRGDDPSGTSWETIPFHFVWISLTLVYGFPGVADARHAARRARYS